MSDNDDSNPITRDTRASVNQDAPRHRSAAVEGRLHGPSAESPFARYLGFRWLDPRTIALTIRPDLVNDAGLLLGPVGFALVDYAMGAALLLETAEDEFAATLNIAINFVQSADRGDVICCARLDRRTRHVAVLSSQTHHADGRLLATAIGSFSIFKPSNRLPS